MLDIEALAVSLGEFSACFDLAVEAGERVAILGESGSGKSTLIDLLAGFLAPTAGTLRWGGRNLADLPPAERPVTTLFQDNNLFMHLSVERNLALGIHPGGRLAARERAAIAGVLERVGLAGFEGRNPNTLSGGQRQRVALARCLLRDKPLLLLDEPFSALDSGTRADMLALTDALVRERATTLLFVTHDIHDAQVLDARCVECRNGELRDFPPSP